MPRLGKRTELVLFLLKQEKLGNLCRASELVETARGPDTAQSVVSIDAAILAADGTAAPGIICFGAPSLGDGSPLPSNQAP